MRIFFVVPFLIIHGMAVVAQPIVDIGLFPNVTADTLEVRLRPTADLSGILSDLNFTLRWPVSSSASLGTRVNACPSGIPISNTAQTICGDFRFRTYYAFGTSLLVDEGCPLVAGEELVITRIPIVDNDGIDLFSIAPNPCAGDSGSGFWVSTGGPGNTGVVYSNLDPGPGNGVVQGRRYLDEDGDCIFGPNDIGIPYRVMELYPGPVTTITSGNGFYGVLATEGDHVLDQSLEPGLYAACPPVEQVPVTIAAGVFGSLDLGNTADDIVDIEAFLTPDVPRCGLPYSVFVGIRNNGFTTSGPIDLSFTHDPQFEVLYTELPPDLIDGNTLHWNVASLAAFGEVGIELALQVPADTALIGTIVDHLVSCSTDPDADPANNALSVPETVVGSIDPNDKTARTSSNTSPDRFYIDLDEAITYRIRFQNTGNYPAWQVIVTDTIADGLDLASFAQGIASHPFDVRFLPGRVVEWTFANINLPDSTNNEPESHGLLSFRIRPVQPVLPGTVISNTANIYFDFNPPVITEPSVLTAEFSTAVLTVPVDDALRVFPNPAVDHIRLVLPQEAASLRIRSSDGRLVMFRERGQLTSVLDIQQLGAGSYLVEVMTTTGHVQRARFIKP